MAQPNSNSPKPVKRVLIYRLGSLGDTIVALPALRIVARAFPDAHRRMLTNIPVNVKAPSAATILENTGLVHSYERYPVATRNPLVLLALWWKILLWRPQALVNLGPRRGIKAALRDKLFFQLCGITTFYGVPDTEDLQAARWQPEHQALEPEYEHLCRQIAELGEGRLDDPASWSMCLTDAEHARARDALGDLATRPLIAVSLGTKVQAKDWGRDNWRALMAMVAQRYPGYGLLLAGAPEESDTSEFAAEGWRTQPGAGPVLNVCKLFSPRETAAAFALADIFIGHDSGPMHMAASVETPCVAIFAARNIPRVWFPHGPGHKVIYHTVSCAGCGLETCIVEKKRCITSITHEEVMAAIVSVLDPIVTHRAGLSTTP